MRRAAALLCALCLPACDPADAPMTDKGLGTWVAMPGELPAGATAVWGVSKTQVYAVGAGGASRYDGDAWRRLDGVPDGSYRAVWGRSSAQVWLGGDDVLLALTPSGWQPQPLLDWGVAIDHYSVLALAGDAYGEYALVNVGGQTLLLQNDGSAWQTPLWASGYPLPTSPGLLATPFRLLAAGDEGVIECATTGELGVTAWDAYPFLATRDLRALRAISGTTDYFAVAGGSRVAFYRDDTAEVVVLGDDRPLDRRRDALAVYAPAQGQAFVAGRSLGTSPIEACDTTGCALEKVPAGSEGMTVRALWGDGCGTVIAVGDVALRRQGPAATGCACAECR